MPYHIIIRPCWRISLYMEQEFLSKDYVIDNVQLKCDDKALDNGYTAIFMLGKLYSDPPSTYTTGSQVITKRDVSINIQRLF